MCDDETGNSMCRVGTLGGVARTVSELPNRDLKVSGFYAADEVLDPNLVGGRWEVILEKTGENEYESHFNGSKVYPPGGGHPEFRVNRSPNKAVLSFFLLKDGTLDNSWFLTAPATAGQTTAIYMDFHHGADATANLGVVATSSAEFCSGTSILRSRAM